MKISTSKQVDQLAPFIHRNRK